MATTTTQSQSLRTALLSTESHPGTALQQKLALAAVGSLVIGIVNSLAIALVLPLVDVATNSGTNSTPVRIARDILGTRNPEKLKLLLSIALIVLFVVKDVGTIWFTWWSSTFINTERVRMSARILERYLTAPFSEMSRRSAGELMRTMDASVLQVFTYLDQWSDQLYIERVQRNRSANHTVSSVSRAHLGPGDVFFNRRLALSETGTAAVGSGWAATGASRRSRAGGRRSPRWVR